jgi:transcriptional regulator with XRE-family HTH domain
MGHAGRKSGSLVGHFLRQRREALGLSQRALGQKFSPPVTTQFISNVERGVTPLPPGHIPTLSRELKLPEAELLSVLEREYMMKLSDKLGAQQAEAEAGGNEGHSALAEMARRPLPQALLVEDQDFDLMRSLYDAYRSADEKTREEFEALCIRLLRMSK